MNKVLQDLSRIKALKHAYLDIEGHDSISTFPDEKRAPIKKARQIIDQYYMAAQSIEKSYDEMIFPLADGDNLIIFFFDETTIAILLTEEKINLPMAHMALKVIMQRIKSGEYQTQAIEPVPQKPKGQATLPPAPKKVPITEPEETTLLKEDNRSFTMYRGQKVYHDPPSEKEKAAPKKKKMMYRGQEM
ncbi:MAG: Unknown protein [uncultured Thiotrichaceae bacterium]|uniref:Uncharacterized protein n=1 Tax=uncultured Thiotrichaceae bacterium TaxID=298394 RepID=A0A6S6SAU2_9GAMM|nr:MAG: Unknown protein [uncultured Thiotrichaceae bacterium]